jgi:hypothetical protein
MDWVRVMIDDAVNRFQHFISGVLGGWHPEAFFWRILLAVLAVGALMLFVTVAHRLLRRVDAKLESWRGTRIPPIHVQTIEIISADRLTDMLKWLLHKSRFLVWLVGLYIFIPLILSLFPQTRGLVARYLDYLIAPLYRLAWGLISFIPNLVFIVVVIVVMRYVLKLLRLIFTRFKRARSLFPAFTRIGPNPPLSCCASSSLSWPWSLSLPICRGSAAPPFRGSPSFSASSCPWGPPRPSPISSPGWP